MHSSIIAVVLMTLAVMTSARPGLLFSLPAASSDTHVVRDALGNQQTSYAYQDGHSSAVAVSRSDVSKHLVYQPVYQPAPVVHYQPVYHQQYQYQAAHPIYEAQHAYYV